MNTRDFTESPRVTGVINRLKKNAANKIYSDVIDSGGNQYVDFVQEGGGVLGVALLGYTYVLEQTGIRFFSLAGTSAGAINTLLLACSGKIDESKSERVLAELLEKNLLELVDGPAASRKFISSVLNSSWIGIKIFWALMSLGYLMKNKGLNPGDNFYDWIEDILKSNGISNQRQLDQLKRPKPAGLAIREGINRGIEDLLPKLKIIAADVTTETRVIFPEMNRLYRIHADEINPAMYLRASMSIPGFFQPFRIVPDKGVAAKDWQEIVKFKGPVPGEVMFVDGGVMSNFPIDVFHNKKAVPRLPTFGVKLGDDRNELNRTGSVAGFLMSVFNSARHVLDYQFLLQNEDYEKLIARIDVGNHNWLNFAMNDEDKLDLFIRGAEAAEEFLMKFDWAGYKEIRKKLAGQNAVN